MKSPQKLVRARNRPKETSRTRDEPTHTESHRITQNHTITHTHTHKRASVLEPGRRGEGLLEVEHDDGAELCAGIRMQLK